MNQPRSATTRHAALVAVAGLIATALTNLPELAQAAAVTWSGGNMTWSQPDTDSFTGTYNSGDTPTFGSTGWGTISIATGGVTPGTITILDVNPLDRATVYNTFAVGEDNALGTASISGNNYSKLNFSNTKGSEVALGNVFAQRYNPTFMFANGDFRLNGTVNGGSYQVTLDTGTGTTVTLPNGVTGGYFAKSGAGILKITSASSGSLANWYAGPIEVHNDQALGTSATAIDMTFWGADMRLIAGGGARTLANNFTIRNNPLIVDGANDLTLTGVLTGGQFTKNGTCTLTLTGANSLSGQMNVNGGLLRLRNPSATYSGNLKIAGGAVVELDRNITGSLGTGSGQVSLNDESGGFAAYGANRIVNFGGAGATVNWGANTHFVSTGKTLVFGSVYANAQIDFQNAINLTWDSWLNPAPANRIRTIQVNDNPHSTADIAVISGQLTSPNPSGYSLLKTGSGVLKLTGNNTYTMPTTISAGTLLVNGTHTGAGNYTVNAGGTLGGTGGITFGAGNDVTVQTGGTIAPGASIGTLSLTNGGLILASQSVSAFEINGLSLGQYDLITSNDQLVYQNGWQLQLQFLNPSTAPLTGSIEIFDFATYSGTNNAPQITLYRSAADSYSFNPATGVLSFSNAFAVPEPAVLILLAVGGWMLVRARRG